VLAAIALLALSSGGGQVLTRSREEA